MRILSLIPALAGAILLCAWMLLAPNLRDDEGRLVTATCLAFSGAAALLVVGLSARGGWLRAGGWFALAILGQAFALQTMRAGSVVAYHVYRPMERLSERWALLLGIGIQAVLVAWGFRPALGPVVRWLGRQLTPVRLLLIGSLMVIVATKFTPNLRTWTLQTGFSIGVMGLSVLNLIVAVRALPDAVLERLRGHFDRLLGPPTYGPEPGTLDRFALLASLWVLVLTASLVFFVYDAHPHVPDEVVYLIHAKYLAAGHLTLPAPPVPAGFDVDLMLTLGDRWFCPVPPGWPLVLALGAFAGVPWLVNPVLAAVGTLLTYLFVREIADRRLARVVLLLLATSPWFLFLGMSFMPHTWPYACTALAALGVARARRIGSVRWAVAAGVGLGLVGLVRPLEGLAVGTLLGLWAIGVGGRRLHAKPFLAFVGSTALVTALVLPYNANLSGSATKFPIMDYIDRVYGPGKNDLGFGENRGLGWSGLDPYPGHDLVDAGINAMFNGFAVNAELFGWGIGSLLPLAFFVLSRGLRREDRLMLASIAVIVGLHTFYWFTGGPDFGARYWFLILLPCLFLTARAFRYLGGALGTLGRTRASVALLFLCATGAVNYVTWRAVDKYPDYRGFRAGISDLAAEHDFGRSLVLVQGPRAPDYASATIYNQPDWEAEAPVYAWDRGGEVRAELLEHYADRPVWLVAGPRLTGGGFELVAGPLAASELGPDDHRRAP